MRFWCAGALAIALAGVFAMACGGVTDPSQNVTGTFSATVPVGSSNFNQINIGSTGEYSVTLVSLSPPAAVFVAVSFNMVTGGTCPITQQPNTLATSGHTVLTGQIQAPGAYCVRVDDEGYFAVPETYTVQVSYP
jgi:hypothetical protein